MVALPVEPSIMGTLFARGLDPDQSAALGAQFTSRDDIVTIVEPVLMAPLRSEWAALKASVLPASRKDKARPGARARLEAFLKKLRKIVVMDPACGSGNFLYVSLQMLLDLEKEVITFAATLGLQFTPEVGVHQLRAFEINPYAYELAQVTVQIGCLQWRRDNGFHNDRTPVLQDLDRFQNEDALLVPHFHNKARTLKEAQADEHKADASLKFYTERQWPECDVLVGNPPFLGDKLMRGELGDSYVEELRRTYGNRIPGQSDLCCYWFEKARDLIEQGKCKRAGLLATQGIRGGANREVLKRIKQTGDIFFAASDRNWVLDGANVHVSMVGFDDGSQKDRKLDAKIVETINANLTSTTEVGKAVALEANALIGFIGVAQKAPFDVSEAQALDWLSLNNPHGKPNSDVLIPICNATDVTKRPRDVWNVDFGLDLSLEQASGYEAPFEHVKATVYPLREDHREARQTRYWWLFARPCPDMRKALAGLPRFLTTPRVSKFRVLRWLEPEVLCDSAVVAFARDDDYFFGVLQSRFHEVWALGQGTQLREKESGFRYTPTTCFETFPFPFPDDLEPPKQARERPPSKPEPQPEADRTYAENLAAKNYFMGKEEPMPYRSGSRREDAHSAQSALRIPHSAPDQHRAAVAAAAKELNELRERWLNPPEWTVEHILEFPGSADGPWSRHVVNPDKNGIGIVRYPHLEPRDADCAAKLKQRTLTNLNNERPTWLDMAHKKLDGAVAAAYGWPADSSDEQILERLLALNLERAAEEAKAASLNKPKPSRSKHADELI